MAAPSFYNQEVYNSLPSAFLNYDRAWLLLYAPELDEKQTAWGFLVNPSILSFSRTAEYGEQSSFAAKIRDRQYSQTSGRTLSIQNIPLEVWYYKKSLAPLINGINALMEASTKNGQFSPPILSFVMGSRRFAPCVLTQLSWDETAWLGGDPASVNLSMTLEEIPNPGLKKDAATPEHSPEQRNPLTLRQREEASNAAKQYLKENQTDFSDAIASIIEANAYFLETDENSGEVSMLDRDKNLIGIVGVYDGQKFDPEKNYILK